MMHDMKKWIERYRHHTHKDTCVVSKDLSTSKWYERLDEKVISFFWCHSNITARLALFIIFFWFGILKVFGLSPAGPLVNALVEVMFGDFVSPESFLIYFGAFEAITGFLILLPKWERITFAILLAHFIATMMPMFVLPDITWYAPFAPTLTGQYIIKNLALLSIGLFLYGRLKPMTSTHSVWAEEREENIE